MINRFADMLGRRWHERAHYAHKRDWLMSLYDRALRRRWGRWLPGRAAVAAIRLKDIPEPFYVRLGTTDWLVLEEIFFKGEYDALARAQLDGVAQVVDLGANVGFSLRLWRQLFPGAALLAVEPDPDNAAAIRRNCGQDKKTIITQVCVAGSARTVYLDRSAGAWGIHMVNGQDNQNRVAVPALPLEDILAANGINGPIDLLKCDIEGAEQELFQNCASWIKRVRALMIEIHAPYTFEQWQRDVRLGGADMRVIWTKQDDPKLTLALAMIQPADVSPQ